MQFQKMDIGTKVVEVNSLRALDEVVLNNGKANLFDEQMVSDLEITGKFLEKSDSKVVLFRSAADSKIFSAGANLKQIRDLKSEKEIDEFLSRGQRLVQAIEDLDKLKIAAVYGGAWGGGFEFVLSCELIWAPDPSEWGLTWKENETVFCLPETDYGMIPGWGGTQRLARRIGSYRALQYIACAKAIGAIDALAMGLVTDLIKTRTKEDFMTEVRKRALNLADRPQSSYCARRAVLRGGYERERMLFAKAFKECNVPAQIDKYFEKRKKEKESK